MTLPQGARGAEQGGPGERAAADAGVRRAHVEPGQGVHDPRGVQGVRGVGPGKNPPPRHRHAFANSECTLIVYPQGFQGMPGTRQESLWRLTPHTDAWSRKELHRARESNKWRHLALNPRLCSCMASYDVASNVCWALTRGASTTSQ